MVNIKFDENGNAVLYTLLGQTITIQKRGKGFFAKLFAGSNSTSAEVSKFEVLQKIIQNWYERL